MDVIDNLDALEQYIRQSPTVPFTQLRAVDREQLQRLLGATRQEAERLLREPTRVPTRDALLNRAGRKWYGGTRLGMVVSSLSCVARGQLRTASRLNVAPAESVPYGFLFSVPQCGIEKMAYRVYSQCLSYARRPV